jgi:predicted phosphodiesterase
MENTALAQFVAQYPSVQAAARALGWAESTLRQRMKNTEPRVLVVGDIHEPVSRPGYLEFCKDLYDKWNCNQVVFIGDVVDHHGISFHANHPDVPGPKDEFEQAYQGVQKWYEAFPDAKVCIGNHDERVIRIAEDANIPSRFLRDYAEVWGTPGWDWQYDFTIGGVYYFHGTGQGGMHPAFNAMKKMLMSVVMGHVHTAAGIKWLVNPHRRIFGMDSGCGIDDSQVAFAYGKHQKQRSVLGAGVVLNGTPYHEIMPVGPGEKYHRSRFKKNKGR